MVAKRNADQAFQLAIRKLDQSVTDFRSMLNHLPTIEITLPQAGAMMSTERVLACEILDGWPTTSEYPGPAISDVARTMGLEQSTASRLISGLVSDGLVTRTPNPNDRRSVLLALSTEGCAALEESRVYRDQASAQVFRDWSPADLAEAAAVLDRIAHCVRERSGVAAADLAAQIEAAGNPEPGTGPGGALGTSGGDTAAQS